MNPNNNIKNVDWCLVYFSFIVCKVRYIQPCKSWTKVFCLLPFTPSTYSDLSSSAFAQLNLIYEPQMKNTPKRLLATKPTRTTQELCAVTFIMKEISDGRSTQCSDTGYVHICHCKQFFSKNKQETT